MTRPLTPNTLIGHCDLISRFSDFALYLDTELVYSSAKTKGNSKCTWCARQSALYFQRLIVISALTSALHVHKDVTFCLGLTVFSYFFQIMSEYDQSFDPNNFTAQ